MQRTKDTFKCVMSKKFYEKYKQVLDPAPFYF